MMDGLTKEQESIDQAIQDQLSVVLQLSEPDRSKCLTCLAYEYFLLDMEERAFGVLKQADPEYFNTHMIKDLKDPQMNEIFMTIVSKLIRSGYIKVHVDGG